MNKLTPLLLFSFLICSIAGPLPEDVTENVNTENNNAPTRKPRYEKVRDMFCSEKGVKRKLNVTDKNPVKSNKSVFIKHEGIDLIIDMNEKETYYGHDIDVDYNSHWTSYNEFIADVVVDYYGRKEDFSVNVSGQIDGKQVNETGKLKFKWDKLEMKYIVDCQDSIFLIQNMSMGFHCLNPTMKAEGLSIADQFEKPIFYEPVFDRVIDFWKAEFKFERNPMLHLMGDFKTCVKK